MRLKTRQKMTSLVPEEGDNLQIKRKEVIACAGN